MKQTLPILLLTVLLPSLSFADTRVEDLKVCSVAESVKHCGHQKIKLNKKVDVAEKFKNTQVDSLSNDGDKRVLNATTTKKVTDGTHETEVKCSLSFANTQKKEGGTPFFPQGQYLLNDWNHHEETIVSQSNDSDNCYQDAWFSYVNMDNDPEQVPQGFLISCSVTTVGACSDDPKDKNSHTILNLNIQDIYGLFGDLF